MSRRARPDGISPQVEWAQADLKSGAGLKEAVSGVEVVLHAATSPFFQTGKTDVHGTSLLLEHARSAGVKNFIYPSIVGIDNIPFSYYRHKLVAESIVREGGVPWSILRITQFHSLLDGFLQSASRFPLMLLPTDFKFQSVDAREAASRLFQCVAAGPSGRLPDFGGPEVHFLGELARVWIEVCRLRRRVIHIPLPGKAAKAFRRGENTVPEHSDGKTTWREWLQQRCARTQNSKPKT